MQKQDSVILGINGLEWKGWQSMGVTRQIDALAGTFSLGLIDRWHPQAKAMPISAGMACYVSISGQKVVDGYIDSPSPAYSTNAHGIEVSGRDKSADMVDCSAVHNPGHWRNLDVAALAGVLAAPFGVSVRLEGSAGTPFASFKLEQGETAFDALDRALKQRELLAYPDGQGGIVLAKIGVKTSGTALVQGKNIKDCSATYDMKDRYSHYIVQGQQPGTDDIWGDGAAAVAATITDPSVPRYRPLIIRAENQVNSGSSKQRAEWEKTVRAARSVTVQCTVRGYRKQDGTLWDVNELIPVDIPYLGISQDLLVSKVTYSRSIQAGSITSLELKDPKSFLPSPDKKKPKDGPDTWGKQEFATDLQSKNATQSEKAQQTIKDGPQ